MIYGYARVSTKSQEDNTSLENQIKILKENNCNEIFKEVHTGATMERPEFIELVTGFYMICFRPFIEYPIPPMVGQ